MQRNANRFPAIVGTARFVAIWGLPMTLFAPLNPLASPAHTPARTQASAQKTFKTPNEAVKALIAAVKANSRDALFLIIGEEMRGVLSSGDPQLDATYRDQFLNASKKFHFEDDADNPNQKIAYFGELEWPFPAPLVKQGSSWRFDGAAGREEVEDRRIGGNELGAMNACYSYAEAQLEYAAQDRDGDGLLEFAQKIVSTPGKQDGLYWNNDHGEDLSPLGMFIAEAAEGIKEGKQKSYSGYHYKILTKQGSQAVGGERDFIVDGNMLGGFALVAWPAEYGKSGKATFLINQLCKVYEKDLGPETDSVAREMTAYNPDSTWKLVDN